MQVKHEAGHYLRIKYDFLEAMPDGSVSTMELDTNFFKEWTLLQVEGEEPIAEKEPEEEVKKGAAKGKKEAPKKPGSKGAA